MLTRLIYNQHFQILMLLILTAVGTYCVITEHWLLAVACAVGDAIAIHRLLVLYSQNSRKVAFMLDAINNNDFTFKYPMTGRSADDRLVSETLTQIAQILSKAKAETIQQEKYYELILDSVKTGIIVIDERGFIYQKNREALRLLGITVLTHILQLDRIGPNLSRSFVNILPGEKGQVSFTTERGTTHLSLRASTIRLREKDLRIVAINDINSELDDKEIDSWIRLTRVLTHEIMNSVTPITSLSDTLLSLHNEMNQEISEGLEVISATGKSLTSFVETYRQFTHIPAPQPKLIDLHPFLDRLSRLAEHHSKNPNLNIHVDVDPDDLILYADENLISQVILNLLKNAIQAIGDEQINGLILLKARSDEKEAITIEVTNNGPLIPPEEAEHIFIPFFTTKNDGNGIGLSISRQIMRLSGGSLELRSNPTAGLTTFVLTFP